LIADVSLPLLDWRRLEMEAEEISEVFHKGEMALDS
jgi:hypothetical protein